MSWGNELLTIAEPMDWSSVPRFDDKVAFSRWSRMNGGNAKVSRSWMKGTSAFCLSQRAYWLHEGWPN